MILASIGFEAKFLYGLDYILVIKNARHQLPKETHIGGMTPSRSTLERVLPLWDCTSRGAVNFAESHDCASNAFIMARIVHDIAVPKADHFVSLRFQIFRSFFIILFLVQMLASIQLDYEFSFRRAEIRNVVSNCMSPAPNHRGGVSTEGDAQLIIPDS